MTTLTEANVEQTAIDWLCELGWQVVLERRLRDALLPRLVLGEVGVTALEDGDSV